MQGKRLDLTILRVSSKWNHSDSNCFSCLRSCENCLFVLAFHDSRQWCLYPAAQYKAQRFSQLYVHSGGYGLRDRASWSNSLQLVSYSQGTEVPLMLPIGSSLFMRTWSDPFSALFCWLWGSSFYHPHPLLINPIYRFLTWLLIILSLPCCF